MEQSQQNLISPVESFFASVPLGSSPIGRVAMGAGLGLAVIYFVRPNMSFFPNGTARPWIVTNWENVEAAVVPWWAWPTVPALLFGFLI